MVVLMAMSWLFGADIFYNLMMHVVVAVARYCHLGGIPSKGPIVALQKSQVQYYDQPRTCGNKSETLKHSNLKLFVEWNPTA